MTRNIIYVLFMSSQVFLSFHCRVHSKLSLWYTWARHTCLEEDTPHPNNDSPASRSFCVHIAMASISLCAFTLVVDLTQPKSLHATFHRHIYTALPCYEQSAVRNCLAPSAHHQDNTERETCQRGPCQRKPSLYRPCCPGRPSTPCTVYL